MILDRITSGDTLDFYDEVPDYPATDGWTLKYNLVPQFSSPAQAIVTLTGTTYNVTDYRVQASPTTMTIAAGVYTWVRWVEKTGARVSLGEGRLEVRANPATLAQGYDSRTQAQKALEDAKTALATFNATSGKVKAYSIAGRSMEFSEAGELVALVRYWENEVRRELAAKAVQEGKPDPRRYYMRLSNG